MSNVACHKLIRETAKGMAEAVYETCALSNVWYKLNPDRHVFVENLWPSLLEEARTTLAQLLSTSISDSLKDEISDALILDNTLREKGKRLHVGPAAGIQ